MVQRKLEEGWQPQVALYITVMPDIIMLIAQAHASIPA